MLFGRCGVWQNDADGEHDGTEKSGRHRVIELRIGVVSTASLTPGREVKRRPHDPCGAQPGDHSSSIPALRSPAK
jgi:hypothetical protein